MKTVNVGLLGLGTVGKGSYKILQMNRDHITATTGAPIKVTKILDITTTPPAGIDLEGAVMTTDPDEVLNDPAVDVVVEAIGGVEPATTFMLTAMRHGKHVVTSNKAAVAANYEILAAVAKENNVLFRFEASVGGGIPVLNAISTQLQGNLFTEVMGILNGTTNYILTQMTEYGMAYEDVLKVAQEKGFAEADPTADVEGIDVANKLCILMALMFGQYVSPGEIPTVGITGITKADIDEAKAKGCKIKLIASAKNEDGKLTYSVKPELLPVEHPLAGVSNEFNAIYITGNAVDQVMLYGRGAGSLPTGSAVVGDIIEIARIITLCGGCER